MNYRDAVEQDIDQIESLLKTYNLPINDIVENIGNFIISEHGNKIIGVGGYETLGEAALIRSFAVVQEYRGKSIGANIYFLLERKLQDMGINELFLLTETATDHFIKLGFTIKKRTNIPNSLASTKQYKELCPSTAIVMFKELVKDNA